MMKQFLRVKQIADQKFQRADKSGVLTEELNAAEKRVDLIKESCCACGKKLSACVQRLTQDSSDRRNSVKKVPESALAQCMEEWGLSLGENSILGMTLVDYARVQDTLANDLLTYKVQVEETVVEPLQNILNVDFNKILKYRKQLFKLTAEMESAKIRYQNALRNSQQMSNSNGGSATATKVQLLKEEMEDITSRVDQCRDSLTAEMFNLISREPEMSEMFVRLCQLQLEYHRKAFYMLESALPELEAQIKCCPYQQVFGVPLEEHLSVTKREIATVIETCVCWLLESAMEEEGLFRIGGSVTKIRKMKSAFDAGFQHLLEDEKDPHNVAGVLKLYLRSLPEPLLTYRFYDQWMDAAMEPEHETRLRSLWSVVNSLPETHFKNLRYLLKFLARLCENSDVNKMSIQNIAIVIGPNLIWPQIDECALGMNMTATNLHSSIVDTLITYADWFFPGECEFYVSTPTSPRHIEGFPPSLTSSQLSLSTTKLSNGDSAVDSMSSSPTNSSPKSPSPRIPVRPRKKTAPRAPPSQSSRNQITRSLSCGGFQGNALAKATAVYHSRSSQLSVSHEDLLNATYNDSVFEEKKGIMDAISNETAKSTMVTSRPKPPRGKPPRHHRNGLPPVAERTHKQIERPSVPPPERPDSFSKTSSITVDDQISESSERVIELDDISISLTSSGSESYNECQMSFMDDSENEEESSKLTSKSPKLSDVGNIISSKEINKNCSNTDDNIESIKIGDIDNNEYTLVKDTDKSKYVGNESVSNHIVLSETNTSDYHSGDSQSNANNSENSFSEKEDLAFANGCHFVGGTPTWFDHYGDDKRQSNTLWFSSNEVDEIFEKSVFDASSKCTSRNEKYRTIIEVGNEDQNFLSNKSYQPTVSGTAIKLRVNSETQNTKL